MPPTTDHSPSPGEASGLQRAIALGLDACCVSDAMDALGLDGAATGLAPQWEGARLVGGAVTVQLALGAPDDGPQVHLGVRAVEQANRGDVIVVANAGRLEMGAWGGLLSVGASERGLAGVVIDGACRDVDQARELGFPVFARGRTMRTARGRVHEVSTGGSVRLGEVECTPGDLVVADASGVVVVPAQHVDAVVARAESIAATETDMERALRQGTSISDVLGRRYETLTLEAEDRPGRVG